MQTANVSTRRTLNGGPPRTRLSASLMASDRVSGTRRQCLFALRHNIFFVLDR